MAEPQPTNVKEGADAPDVLPASKEDRKAAQALSSLDEKFDNTSKKPVDLKALNDAMSRLEASAPVKQPAEIRKEEPKKVVKVAPTDVALLVEHLDVTKVKATELLKAHDADVIRTMTAWVKGVA